jgi:non-ribosomal peptide synthetase component F
MLEILKSGGAFLSLDPSFPAKRIKYMLEDSQTTVIISKSELADNISANSAKTVLLSDEFFEQKIEGVIPKVVNNSENLAYLLYTSGLTGKLKSVQNTHQSIVNSIASMKEKFKLTVKDNVLAITTFFFDISLLEIYLEGQISYCG